VRVAFDGTTLRPARTGVGCYAERLLRHIAAASPKDEFVVISNRRADLSAPLPSNVEVFDSRRAPVSLAWMQLLAPGILRQLGADVAHFTNGVMPLGSDVPSVVTIHDMSLTLYPRYHPVRRVLLHRPLVDRTALRATAIITHSASAKRDIVRLYGLEEARVHVVHLAAAPEFTPVRDEAKLHEVKQRYRLPDRFVLYVGAIEPRKNLTRLIEAFGHRFLAGDLPHHLICVGPYGWRARGVAERVAALNLGNAIRFLGYVPLDDLPAIYSASEAFVFPSLYEGFGLPVVEALACGTPVLVGKNPALLEVGGDAVASVDPRDTAALGEALVSIACDSRRQRELASKGVARARAFSWQRAAHETLAVYRTAAVEATTTSSREARVLRNVQPAGVAAARTATADAPVVLFGQAYYLRFDPKLWEARQPYPPLGTLYAASYLRERGHRVALFDAMLADSEEEWAGALDRERPALAVIYEDNFNYLSKMCLLRMRGAAVTMIKMARARGVPVVVSGSDATDRPELYLNAGALCVVIGEGELTVADIAARFIAGRLNLSDIRGTCFRDAHGAVIRTPPREQLRDLDQLPLPAWDLVDVDRYRAIWHEHHGYHSMNLVTTRGCPYHCNWCAKPIYGQRYAVRSAEHVADEVAWLKRVYGPDHLWIADDIFGLRPGWIEQFSRLLADRGAVIPFRCLMRADQVTPPVVSALNRAGCRTVWIGAESGSQKILDAMEKGLKVDDIVSACRLLHAGGIKVGLFLQFGYPGEMREDIDRTLAMVRACRPDDIGVSVSYPLPGTPFYARVRAELGNKRNWVDSNDLETMYHATYGPEFYRVLHQAVHAEFRMRRASAVISAAAHPWTLRPAHARQLASAAFNALKLPMLRWEVNQLSRGPISPTVRSTTSVSV
jgi:radical SAM superfamily enzyme YgiQ (UPF0313 family)/glycosyltransferase involved in cell wall biosynthesis